MADVQIPKQYKACVYDQPGKISTKVEMLDTPEPGPGEVLVNLYRKSFSSSHYSILGCNTGTADAMLTNAP